MDFLERQRCDSAYESYTHILAECEDITDEPTLPHARCPPRRIDDGAPAHVFDSPKSYFKKQYFEVLDLVTGELKKKRFQQDRGMPVAAVMKKLLPECACD